VDEIVPGLAGELETTVSEADTAARWGSGLVPTLSTPTLVALMESAAVQALAGRLAPGQTSVGARVELRHLAPTPVGMRVRARAQLVQVDGRRLVFEIEAWDEREAIGVATHERFIVDMERFVRKAMAKHEPPGDEPAATERLDKG